MKEDFYFIVARFAHAFGYEVLQTGSGVSHKEAQNGTS